MGGSACTVPRARPPLSWDARRIWGRGVPQGFSPGCCKPPATGGTAASCARRRRRNLSAPVTVMGWSGRNPARPRSFSAGRESCAPQPSQWRSRSRLSPATFSPRALGSGSRQPSCSRYFPSRARLLCAATMRKKGRLVQPPRAKRITTCPPR